jgi:RNA polymerase-interacting CarD/CdnL/TRCF family regulator
MSLNAQQKDALTVQLSALLEHDEPRAFLATLHRMAERQAFTETRRDRYDDAFNWQAIADALAHVRRELLRTQQSSERSQSVV